MPELPEVTTIINVLKHSTLLNNKIISVDVLKPKVIQNTSIQRFKNFFINEKIINIERLGKYIIYKLTNKKVFVSHLRMEGKFFYDVKSTLNKLPHLMVLFNFKDGNSLAYCDSRMFGTFSIYTENNYLKSKELSKLSIDPLDKKFISKFLFNKINKINQPIKTVLLNQSIISGIGNIYADEILFMCKINPLTKAKALTIKDCELICKYSKKILFDAIKCKGTTIFSYKFDKNHSGEFQKYLKVHQRENKLCKNCKTPIVKIKINGRGTYFCPKCQKEKKC
ncbi:MAG: DNA-formamidopyrimidine glycosylase [Mycoplasma sp.]|nr:DNA-formamidopyrimidine glycosylase [Mycoplasma sp.]